MTGTISVMRAQKLGSLSGTVAAGKTGTLTVKLTRAGWNALEDHSAVHPRLRGTTRDHAGDRTAFKTAITLKLGKGNFPAWI